MTVQLSREQFVRAKAFVMDKARPLEKALFAYEFESGSIQDVLGELARFQNEDGGFGRALEPDLRTPVSSVLATTTALQLLEGLDSEDAKAEGMISRAMNYLLSAYISERNGWDIIPLEAEASPRAVWWDFGAFRDHWGNPNAEVAGYFISCPSSIAPELLKELLDYSLHYLNNECELNEMHELFCYLRLSEKLTPSQYALIEEKLLQFIANCVPKQPADRAGYGATPLQIAGSPDSKYYPLYADVLPDELDRLIHSQAQDGSWEPNWSWFRFEEEWQAAREEWQGFITLKNLKVLKDFQRIAFE
ncbi:hypothetical protein [Paenibacillus pinistramenti]|uniref:hypothetical protein n=1 Tax=Paenibacillus pinistramenti TaxID=1768003 RepID=UPI001EF0FE3A|nr:hypothetical protein [Paenibacillus pinistramenti]